MHNPLDLSGGRILVTGAGSGIGRATAVLLGMLGAAVVLVDINEKGLEETLAQVSGGGHALFTCDLRDVPSLPAAVTSWAEQVGQFTGFVHAAGLPCVSPVRLLGREASVMGLVGSSGAAGYSLSKAALIGMSRSMALELAPRRIRVNCVAPGFVRTPMLDKVGGTWDAEQAAQVEAQHPLGLGEPEDVANSIAFLLSPAARWITGTTLTLDGGYTAH